MLRSGCILTPRRPEDGLRISIMSRHTQNDGVTPDPRITSDKYDEHWAALAPPPRLVGRWYRRQVSWPNFQLLYEAHLAENVDAGEAVEQLIRYANEQTVTVLCIETEPTQCHRRLLLEHIVRLCPDLAVEIT